ncbi:MAG: hypothetical protein DRP71_12475, partial [Verrucomicrobia bacterium]
WFAGTVGGVVVEGHQVDRVPTCLREVRAAAVDFPAGEGIPGYFLCLSRDGKQNTRYQRYS